jgi:hypothetical protein
VEKAAKKNKAFATVDMMEVTKEFGSHVPLMAKRMVVSVKKLPPITTT